MPRPTFVDLWRPSGTIDRGTYALVGVVGFAVKHNLDRLIATLGFHRRWGLFSYWVPIRDVVRITALQRSDVKFLLTMVAVALPFVWLGLAMTMKRLRSAKLPLPLVMLFFVPFLNLIFFLVLSLIPEREAAPAQTGPSEPWLLQIIPESSVGSAAVSLLVTVPLGLAMGALGVHLRDYGWGLFVAVPFVMGFTAAAMYGARQARSAWACVHVASTSILLLGLVLFALAVEGLACLVMALPIALPIAVLGGLCGYLAQRRRLLQSGSPAFLSVLFLFAPGVQWTEHLAAPLPTTFAVKSSIIVHGPPEKVWRQVIAFSEIPPPKEWVFRAGIAYPIRAEMIGSGAGAERHCVFSTGAFVEPIQIWDAPRLLKFSVASNPPPMEEWTIYSHIDPPHLHGFLISNGGQFLLTPLPHGETRLEGTTWYHHGLWPAAYWRLWSDVLIHRIHMRVLTHIRDEVEKEDR